MTHRAWTITTELSGIPREIELHLYDSVRQMRKAADAWVATEGAFYGVDSAPEQFNAALALCHALNGVWTDDNGVTTPEPLVAIIRLVRGHLSPEIVSHEITHAAFHMYGLDVVGAENTGHLIDYFDGGNEDFGYLYGGLFATVLDAMNGEITWTSV